MTERISKSAKKRRFKQEEAAAEELSRLSDRDLRVFPGSEAVRMEILACRGLKGGARKRQVKYLAKVMRQDSMDELLDYLAEKKGSALKRTMAHKEAERLRDVVINEAMDFQQFCLQNGEEWEPDWPGDEMTSVAAAYPLNERELRQSVFQYTRTRSHSHYREVFRILKAAVDKKAMLNKINPEKT